jgi:hypothetical protein
MSEESLNHGNSGHGVEFEREDLSTRGVFAFMIGLAIIGVGIYVIITGMYSFLDKYERSQMAPSSPLVKPEESAEIRARRVTQDYVEKRFQGNGAPLLEIDERGQFHDFLRKQEQQLNSYGWVDEKAGVLHIPIERAMGLIAQRGLPVLPQGGADTSLAKGAAAGARKAPKQQ